MALSVRRVRLLSVLFGSVCCVSGVSSARAQADAGSVPPTRFDRLVSHFSFAASAVGEFDSSVSGPVQNNVSPSDGTLSVQPTHSVGAMGTIRAKRSPWVGGEFNYRWAKYTYNFNYTNSGVVNFSSQNTANELTLGYIAQPDHPVFGFQPFVGVGAGSVEFKPSKSSGSGLPVQARAAYYYTVGGDKPIVNDTFGLRVGFRQVFYLAPDFGQNYLLIKKLAISSEPTVGFYVHF